MYTLTAIQEKCNTAVMLFLFSSRLTFYMWQSDISKFLNFRLLQYWYPSTSDCLRQINIEIQWQFLSTIYALNISIKKIWDSSRPKRASKLCEFFFKQNFFRHIHYLYTNRKYTSIQVNACYSNRKDIKARIRYLRQRKKSCTSVMNLWYARMCNEIERFIPVCWCPLMCPISLYLLYRINSNIIKLYIKRSLRKNLQNVFC